MIDYGQNIEQALEKRCEFVKKSFFDLYLFFFRIDENIVIRRAHKHLYLKVIPDLAERYALLIVTLPFAVDIPIKLHIRGRVFRLSGKGDCGTEINLARSDITSDFNCRRAV